MLGPLVEDSKNTISSVPDSHKESGSSLGYETRQRPFLLFTILEPSWFFPWDVDACGGGVIVGVIWVWLLDSSSCLFCGYICFVQKLAILGWNGKSISYEANQMLWVTSLGFYESICLFLWLQILVEGFAIIWNPAGSSCHSQAKDVKCSKPVGLVWRIYVCSQHIDFFK